MTHLGQDAISLLTLLFLEIVLGIDNLVFVSIACQRLPKHQQAMARKFGLLLALFTRLLLLSCVNFLANFRDPILTINQYNLSGRDILLMAGGLFLLYKGTDEIHAEFQKNDDKIIKIGKSFLIIICQIAVLDIIFSLDSVITAIGMTQQFYIMALAICIAILVMIFASTPLSNFIEANPSVKMLAVSFILMVGMVLIADGFHFHIPRAYIYFAIAFSLFVETLNIVLSKKKSRPRL